MSSINILIIFIYFIFVLFQFNSSQLCSKRTEKCNDSDKKCCKALNCKNKRMIGDVFQYKCFYAGCVHEGNKCDDNGRMCCYGFKCNNLSSKCEKCVVDGLEAACADKCCSGQCKGTTCICYSDV